MTNQDKELSINFNIKYDELPFEDSIIVSQTLLICFYFANYFTDNKDEKYKLLFSLFLEYFITEIKKHFAEEKKLKISKWKLFLYTIQNNPFNEKDYFAFLKEIFQIYENKNNTSESIILKYNYEINKLYKKIEVTQKPKYLLKFILEIKNLLKDYCENMTNISESYNSIIKTRKIIKKEMSISESEKKIMNFKIELDKNEETFQKLKDENNKLVFQNINLQNEIKSSQSKFDILLSKFEKLENEIQTLKSKNTKFENEIQTLKSKNTKFENEIQTLKSKNNKLANQNQTLSCQCQNYEIQINNLQTEITLLISQKQSSIEKINKLKEENSKLAKKNEELNGTFNFFREVIEKDKDKDK